MLGMAKKVQRVDAVKWSFLCLTVLMILISACISGCQGTAEQNQIPTEVVGSIKTNGYKLKGVLKGSTAGDLIIEYVPTGGVIDATIDVKCSNGSVATISTGNNQGSCGVTTHDGKVVGGNCDDHNGNNTYFSCTLNSCMNSNGSGKCTLKQ
jgi:hypothetical protein